MPRRRAAGSSMRPDAPVAMAATGRAASPGPAIVQPVAARADADLVALLRTGKAGSGMPAFDIPAEEMGALVAYLRTLVPMSRTAPPVVVRKAVQTTDGRTLEGQVLNEGLSDLQLRTDDGRIHLLRRTTADRYRTVTSQRDWTTYHGDVGGNRFTTLTQIDTNNVARLAPRWAFPIPNVGQVETTPIVVAGIMYISSANEVYALDAGSGRPIWHYQRPRTKGLAGNAAAGFNRGVAISGDRLFLLTDHAHMSALDRFSGELLWDTEMADWRENYNGTAALLWPASSSSPARPVATRECEDSSRPTRRRPVRRPGASGRCPSQASPVLKRGRGR